MAQTKETHSRRIRKTARRLGMQSKRSVIVACAVLILLLGSVGFYRVFARSTFSVERGADVTDTHEYVDDTSSPDKESQSNTTREAVEQSQAVGSATQRVIVHVDGAVVQPGVYELEGSSPRVNDAVQCAGGLTPEADTTMLNLAMPVTDGQKIHVLSVGEEAPDVVIAQSDVSQPEASDDSAGSSLININTADEAELQALPGVGEATASAIVKDRTQNGTFSSPEDIMRVSGIGEKKYEKMKDQICV